MYSRVRNLHGKKRIALYYIYACTKDISIITSLGPLQRTFQNKLVVERTSSNHLAALVDESNGQDERPPNGPPSHATWRSWRDVALISPHFAHCPPRVAVAASRGPGRRGAGPGGDRSDSAIRIGIFLVHVVGVFCAQQQSGIIFFGNR